MKTTYTIVITVLSIVAAILSPDQIGEYVMFGLLVMMISITRWESDKILKALKANAKNESEVLNIPRVSNCALHKNQKLVENMCISYRHDFGLLMTAERNQIRRECEEWLRAYENNREHCC